MANKELASKPMEARLYAWNVCMELPRHSNKNPLCRHEIFDNVRAGVALTATALTATALNILPKSSIVIFPQPTTFRDIYISNIVPEKSGKGCDVPIITISRAPCRRKSKNSHRT